VNVPIDHDRLLAEARSAANASYSPYSRFRVGAAVVAADGAVIRGCNVENASYGLAVCAERTAVLAAVAAGHRDLVAIAVSCPDGDRSRPGSLMPCGACRQVLAELLAPGAVVLVDGVGAFTVEDLLPRPFRFP
jgi:cytidine deaminase